MALTAEERLAELGRRIDRLGASAQAGTDEARIGIRRRVAALRKEQALTRAAVHDAAAGIEENMKQLDTRINMAEQSAAVDVADDMGTFVEAVMAELDNWDVYLERLQLKAARTAGRSREQAEGAIAEIRRRRIALGARLGEARSASGEAWHEAREQLQVARNELERRAAEAEARLAPGGTG